MSNRRCAVACILLASVAVFALGNLSAYLRGSVERWGSGALRSAARAASYVFPNFSYFTLQTHFGEGRIVSLKYLAASAAYTLLYVALIFSVAGRCFERREVR